MRAPILLSLMVCLASPLTANAADYPHRATQARRAALLPRASSAPAATAPKPPASSDELTSAQWEHVKGDPFIHAYAKLGSDPVLAQSITQVKSSGQGRNLLYAELGWFAFMLLFRSWRFSKSRHLLPRIWTGAWTQAIFLSGALVVIPWIVYGDPYRKIILSLWQVL